MSGRKQNKSFINLGFILKKINNKYFAMCNVCQKVLRNTAEKRLQMHRNICKLESMIDATSLQQNVPWNICKTETEIQAPNNMQQRVPLEFLDTLDTLNATDANKHSQNIINLGFIKKKISHKDLAICTVCHKTLKTTSKKRLQGHRNICKAKSVIDDSSSNLQQLDTDDFSLLHNIDDTLMAPDVICELKTEMDISCNDENETVATNASSLTFMDCSSASYQNNETLQTERKKSTETQSTDKLSKQEEAEINDALATLVYGFKLPFGFVDSVHFKHFIQKIRPAYVEKIPERKTLATTLLDRAHSECILKAKQDIGPGSVLLIDVRKNVFKSSQKIVTMIHNANGEQAYLHTQDVTCETDMTKQLSDVVMHSIAVAKNLYATDIFALVSDSGAVLRMLKDNDHNGHIIWHSICNSHLGNLLLEDILKESITDNVICILREFKQACYENLLVENGGSQIKLPDDNSWCSYRDAYCCLLKNLDYMKLIAADSNLQYVKLSVAHLLFDEQFIGQVQHYVNVLASICALINKCQTKDCSIADAANEWINLKLTEEFDDVVEVRRNEALNCYALAAYYLHPDYDNNKLSETQLSDIYTFLITHLSAAGIEDWNSFRERKHFFKNLFEKNITKACVFWNIAELKHPTLAKLAKKLLLMPASCAQLKRLFSSEIRDHSPEPLTFERSEKLMHLYYSLKIADFANDVDSCENF